MSEDTASSRTAAERDDLVWRALADRTRREVLDLLAARPRTTGELVERFPHLSRTAVMKHLDVLEGADLLLVRREGRMRWNQIHAVPIEQIHQRWVAPHVQKKVSALLRLKEHAEEQVKSEKKRAARPAKRSKVSPKRRKR